MQTLSEDSAVMQDNAVNHVARVLLRIMAVRKRLQLEGNRDTCKAAAQRTAETIHRYFLSFTRDALAGAVILSAVPRHPRKYHVKYAESIKRLARSDIPKIR
jgi:hypothetical protein